MKTFKKILVIILLAAMAYLLISVAIHAFSDLTILNRYF